MTKLRDWFGELGDKLTQEYISVGSVYLLNLDKTNGITPKNGDSNRNKFFIVLGFTEDGNIVGGLVINSVINYNLPPTITNYQLAITAQQCPFLEYDSFVNCSKIIRANRSKFSGTSYRGSISDPKLMKQIINTIKNSPTISRKELEIFDIK